MKKLFKKYVEHDIELARVRAVCRRTRKTPEQHQTRLEGDEEAKNIRDPR